ncbi:MAG TPA: J domain-containing protein [Candidatus Dependentiae bacterium]|nr:J domain-containing protein [Candidatus Dependentiae bacterium]HRQ62490.1 J domain-containing protein [Candidatus Dependentiae bacterium]
MNKKIKNSVLLFSIGCFLTTPLLGMMFNSSVPVRHATQQNTPPNYTVGFQSCTESGFKDFYVVLGVPRNATLDQLKRAYRAQSLIHHSDKGGTGNTQADLNKAKEILIDNGPAVRAQYDQQLLNFDYVQFQRNMPWSLANKWTISASMCASATCVGLRLYNSIFGLRNQLDGIQNVAQNMIERLHAKDFDRYHRTQDMAPLLIQCANTDTLLASLSNDDLRIQLISAIVHFDEAYDALFNIIAWQPHTANQNNTIMLSILVQQRLQELINILNECRNDLGYNKGIMGQVACAFGRMVTP